MEVSDHDYCTSPEPAAVDMVLNERDELREENCQLRTQLEDLMVTSRFGLRRFEGSDSQIRVFTR